MFRPSSYTNQLEELSYPVPIYVTKVYSVVKATINAI